MEKTQQSHILTSLFDGQGGGIWCLAATGYMHLKLPWNFEELSIRLLRKKRHLRIKKMIWKAIRRVEKQARCFIQVGIWACRAPIKYSQEKRVLKQENFRCKCFQEINERTFWHRPSGWLSYVQCGEEWTSDARHKILYDAAR